jgi:threonine/homoserine/homoserine lactone efflux protein
LIEGPSLALFFVAAVALLVTPGPAVVYIVTRSVDQGLKAGLVSVLGIFTGGIVQVAAAALGLSALVFSSALAFSVVKYAGAAYLVYLGVRRLMGRDGEDASGPPRRDSLRRIFAQGALVNMLNPKSALFFVAFLPQFVDVSRGNVPAQLFFLGLAFTAMGLVSDGTYAVLAGSVGGWLRRSPGFLKARRWVSGTIYVALGAATAVSGSGKSE